MPSCRVCGQDNPDVARFCLACGAALAPAEERREERKVVTVLFADLVGFTSRAQTLDPEDVRAVLSPYWKRLRAELEQMGGTVEKFIGDAVMALFGAPSARPSPSATGCARRTTCRCASPSTPAKHSCCWTRVRPRARGWRPATW